MSERDLRGGHTGSRPQRDPLSPELFLAAIDAEAGCC
jgi:hypothetical protein